MTQQRYRYRHSDVALGALLCAMAVFIAVLFAAADRPAASDGRSQALVDELGLTDLCLFTDARYTRHPSLADLHAPYQDHPMALERFPSGTLLAPPSHLSSHAPLDR